MRRLSVVLATAALAACYKYVPESAPAPTLGMEYRAHLTDPGSQSLAPVLGQSVVTVDGRFVEERQNAWLVAVSATMKRDEPRPTIWQGESITVPRDAVARLERRELDRRRTIRATVFGVGGALAVTGLIFAIGGKVSGNGDGGGGPIMPARVVP